MQQTEPTVAHRILEQLQLWGVKRIYGVVGDAIFGLMDAIAKQNQIQFIAVKHEATAAMMASAEAKLTGGLGVCTATMGPGLANLLNGLADACKDKASVLAITGQASTDKIGTDYKQYINQQELIKPLAAYSTLLAHPHTIIDVLTKAMHLSLVKGAVTHLSVPKDMFTMPTTALLRAKPSLLKGTYYFEADGLALAIDIMKTAQRPMILAGTGAYGAAQHVEALAERWGAGLLVSLGAKGMLPETSPHLLGGIGQGGNPYAAPLFKEADVVLLIGDTWWPEGYVPEHARIIQIDYMQENIGKGIPVEVGIVGDSGAVVPLLVEKLPKTSPLPVWESQWKEAKQKWAEQNEQEGNKTSTPLYPARIVRAIENAVQPNAIITLDTGDMTVWVNRSFRAKEQDFLFSGEWRTMGFGLPAALAAKLCMPERQVVAIVGDGGIAMTLADLLTAARYSLQLTVVVCNNGYLQMERDKMIAGGFRQEGVDVTNPDFVKAAEACRWNGYRVDSDTQLEDILQQAFTSNRPALIDVATASVMHPETKG
ncbi:thiamine pyrophosphate-binding protein [Aneurinibacillus sp. REN35]|uniref:thiamine pyrophosphate-binding protein n=1 Tax=Aneurinibacillus sp. REN35 TaxID=3237286 RepID=UPI003528C93A